MIFRSAASRALIRRRCTTPSSSDRGSAAVELVILTPLIVVLFLAVAFLGRAGQSSTQVRHAADQGARAASQASMARMPSAARVAVLADLAANGVACTSPTVDTAVSLDSAGAPRWVTVSVRCAIERGGLELLGPAPRSVSASSTEMVDRYRAP